MPFQAVCKTFTTGQSPRSAPIVRWPYGAFHSRGGVLISVEAKLVMLVNVQAQIKMHNLFCLSTIM